MKKQLLPYFVKGLDKVTLDLTETGVFRISQKYVPLEIVQKEAQPLIRSLDAELEKQLGHSLEHSQEKQGSVEKLSFGERLNRAQRQAELLETQQEKEKQFEQ